MTAAADRGRVPLQGGAAGRRSVAAQTISGLAVTGDRATIDARRVEVHRSSASTEVPARLSNLPKPPTRSFVGRAEELTRLDALMDAGRGVISQVVHGLGGVGKTELALQYAHLHRDRYQVRWWLNCETDNTIIAGLVDLTVRVNADLTLTGTPAEAAAWAVGWLQNRAGWLLVLDNVEDVTDVEGLLAQLDSGDVLITTRRDIGWDRLVDNCLRLDMLAREPAVQMLVGGEDGPDLLSAAVLADELGYLPLALQQAASYVRQTRTPVATYLKRLRAQPERVLALIAEGDRAERAVAQVWLETLSQLRAERPAAIEVLRLLTCFAPDDVPRSLLVDDSVDVVEVERALAVLASYSLITLTGATVGMHRLLQTVVRDQARAEDLPPDDDAATPHSWTQILNRAVSALKGAQPRGNLSDAVHTWPQWTLLAPHIDALAAHIHDESVDLDFAHLIGQLAFFYSTQARYEAALSLDRRALAISEAALPDGHSDIALRLDNLAYTLGALGRPAEALPLRERALAISEAALPDGHPSIATRLNNLAYTLGALGRRAEALPLQERALAISEAALPDGHPDIALRLDNLAYTLGALGRPAEALPLRERALAISEAALPDGHPDIAVRLDNLAYTLGALGRPAEALPLRERALAISEAALPDGHPDIALRLNNLAYTLGALGRPAEALPLRERAASIRESARRPANP